MRRVAVLAAVVMLVAATAFSATAQPNASPAIDEAVAAVTDAGLSEARADAVRSILEGVEREPGALWKAAGAVHQELGTTGALAYAQALQANAAEVRQTRRAAMQDRGERGPRRGRGMRETGQGRGGPDQAGTRLAALDLTDEQTEQIAEIRREHREKMRALRAESDGRPSPAMREQMQTLRAEMRADIEAVLTEEQKQQWKEQRDTRRDEARAVRNEVLNLSEEQIEQMEALRTGMRSAMQGARERGQRPDRMAHRASGRAAAAQILDDDQEAIFMTFHALRSVMRAHGGPAHHRGFRGGGR